MYWKAFGDTDLPVCIGRNIDVLKLMRHEDRRRAVRGVTGRAGRQARLRNGWIARGDARSRYWAAPAATEALLAVPARGEVTARAAGVAKGKAPDGDAVEVVVTAVGAAAGSRDIP